MKPFQTFFLIILASFAAVLTAAEFKYPKYVDEFPINSNQFPIKSNEFPINSNDFQISFPKMGKIEQFIPKLAKHYLQDLLPIKRQIDGSNNNIQQSKWGATQAISKRMSGDMTTYKDYSGYPIDKLQNPRLISNQIGSMRTFQPNDQQINQLFVIWGQFLDHDMVFTAQQKQENSQHMNIKIPRGDPFFDKQNTGNHQMNFVRSAYHMIDGIRFPSNSITAWVDGGNIYGSSQQVASKLRAFKDGKLRQSEFNMLPKDQTGKSFEAGDVRVNENFALTSMHTLWMRQHNRICDEIKQKNPSLTDEQIYQMSRNYVIGLVQKITFYDFLPRLLGPAAYEQYFTIRKQYDKTVNPNIMLQMATGLFRVGHTLLNSDFSMRNQNGQVTQQFALQDAFGRSDVFNKSTTLDQIFMGLIHTPAKQKNCQVIDSVRNFLVLDANNRQHKLDLFSLNIQRGRDHGILSYGNLRKLFGLNPVQFAEMCPKQEDAKKLAKIYKNIDQMDLWVGTICQKPVNNGIMGQLGSRALGLFFSRLKYGDRFYFEWAYPKRIVQEILSTTLTDIIKRNTKLTKIPLESFQVIKKQLRVQSPYLQKEPFSLPLNKLFKKFTN